MLPGSVCGETIYFLNDALSQTCHWKADPHLTLWLLLMDLDKFYWKDCRETETATPGLMAHPGKLLMLDLPRNRYKHAHNGYYKGSVCRRDVPLIHPMQAMISPGPALKTWSFLLSFPLWHPSGRTDNSDCTERERITPLYSERGLGLHKLTSNCSH